MGTDIASGVPIAIPPGYGNPTGSLVEADLGASCLNSDPNHICLGMKYVVYVDASGNPVVSQNAVINDIITIDQIWSVCNVGFQIDSYVQADPKSYGLNLYPKDYNELDTIRGVFDDAQELLVVTTGKWDRSGTLGNTSANAWTNMPGSGVLGVLMEAPVGDYGQIIAHELGHYLNLGHVSDTSNVMNPVIYPTSTALNSNQCDAARAAAKSFWGKMFRSLD